MVRAALHCAIAVVAILAICRPAVSFPINGPRPADKDTLGWGPRPIPINISVSPVVFVPGIGGSVLVDKPTGLRVWIRFYEAAYYFQRFMWGIFNATTGTVDPLPGQRNVVPLLSGFGLDGIRNLDPSVHWPIYDYVSYFDAAIKVLENNGWVAGRTLFGVPWDWRQSMCWPPTIERLRESIVSAQQNAGGRKVSLVTHSMGGLVTKCFMAKYPELFASAVEAWITVSCPHQGGGAKIYMEFLQGYNLGNIVIGYEDAKRLALESPAVYELLPQESFPWKRPPYVTLKHNGTVYTFSTGADCPANRQYSRCFREANRGHNITVPDAGTTYPEPFNEAAWRLSQATRAAVYRPNLPDTVRYYNVYGVNQETPHGLEFEEVSSWGELQTAKYTIKMLDGDGTVPVESSVAHNMRARASKAVAGEHTHLMMAQETLEFMMQALYDRL